MRALECTQQHLAAIVEGSADAIVTKDLDSIILSWNAGAERLFGYTGEEAIGQPITIIFPEDRIDEETSFIERLRRGERIVNFETVRKCKDGSLVPVSLTVSPVHGPDGQVIGASKIARDITLQRQIFEQQRLLLAEMRHRVGNAFALAGGLIAVAARKTDSVEHLASEMRCRLNALASLNSLAVSDPSGKMPGGMPLLDLLNSILEPFSDGLPVSVVVPDLCVAPSAITPLTLVVFELSTNAVKYGGLSENGQGVQISAQVDGGRLLINWNEASVREPGSGEPDHEGFGTSMCKTTVSSSLDGTFSRRFAPDGMIASLDIDLATVTGSRADRAENA